MHSDASDLGRYRLDEQIGGGGSADVHRAWDHISGREVAIKLFHAGSTPAQHRRQVRELRILDRLRHPGLVPLYDSGMHDGRVFLVMGLIHGPTLAERIAEGPLPAEETIALGARVAGALAYVHRAGITHRDIKPANVLLGPGGPVLGDFGVAQSLDTTRFTTPGAVVGTAAYMAPEQVRGEPVGPPADVYALALVLLECLSGQREYLGSLTESAVARLLRPPSVPPDLPPHFADLLRRMGERDPLARPSAREVATVLGDDGVTRPLRAKRRSRWWRRPMTAGATAAAMVSAFAFTLLGTSETDVPSAPEPAPVVQAPTSSIAPPLTSAADPPVPVADPPVPVADPPVPPADPPVPAADPPVPAADTVTASHEATTEPPKGNRDKGKQEEKRPDKVPHKDK